MSSKLHLSSEYWNFILFYSLIVLFVDMLMTKVIVKKVIMTAVVLVTNQLKNDQN